jgi:O-methyltransferase
MNKHIFCDIVTQYSMTSNDRINALYDSLESIRLNNIDGDFVECGVWKGGNILGIMEYLNYYKMVNKKIWLYDTFKGMTDSEDIDIDYQGTKAIELLGNPIVKAEIGIEEVKKNLSISSYPKDNLNYIIGDINETLNEDKNIPNSISLLRLDTDWYKSTKKELQVLYPKLKKDGILIVDDYGHWQGAKKAVDEYFENISVNIEKIDYTGIKIIKNGRHDI